MASKMAAVTVSGGYFGPWYAGGSSSLSQISVSIGPGLIRATWIFEPARSFHNPSVKLFIAAFDAAYMASRGGATLAANEEMLTIVPPLLRSRCGIAAIVVHTHDKKLTRITCSASSTDM